MPTKEAEGVVSALKEVCSIISDILNESLFLSAIHVASFFVAILFDGNSISTLVCLSVITTDQGKEFRNELNKQLTDSFGIKHRLTTAYHPQVPVTT